MESILIYADANYYNFADVVNFRNFSSITSTMSAISSKLIAFCIFFFCAIAVNSFAQEAKSDSAASVKKTKKKKDKNPGDTTRKKIKLFKDDEPLQMTVSTDIRALLGEKKRDVYQKATITLRLPDSSDVSEVIDIRTRGNFRRDFCYFPSMMLNFAAVEGNRLASLEKMKIVCTCKQGSDFEQLVLKEYLTYKIYNELTDTSFRVRLTKITFLDTDKKRKPFSYYGFMIEDVDDMAKRNDCREIELKNLHTELTDRKYMTLVALFQYMIGNTDWSVPGNHNMKFLRTRDTVTSRPLAVPYDFDYSGLVNAPYAIPSEAIGTTSVTERVYRGFLRSQEELEETAGIFLAKKEKIYSIITSFEPLAKKEKDQMIRYLDDFYRTITDPRAIKREFIDNARKS